MAIRRSHLALRDEAHDREEAPRLHVPVIPALFGTLALVNVASAVLALIG